MPPFIQKTPLKKCCKSSQPAALRQAARLLYACLLLALLQACTTQADTPPSSLQAVATPTPPEALHALASLDSLAESRYYAHGHIGFALVDLKSGRVLAQRMGEKGFMPASMLKILPTGLVMEFMGPAYRYPTELRYTGSIEHGVLKGDLFVRGSGDPSLGAGVPSGTATSAAMLAAWVQAVKQVGITRIEGSVMSEIAPFPAQATMPGTPFNHLANYYGSPAYALNWQRNEYALWLKPGTKYGDPTQVLETEPIVPGMTIDNAITTGWPGSGDQGFLYGAPFSMERFATGTIPPGQARFKIRGALPNPPLLLAQKLTRSLRLGGIAVKRDAATSLQVSAPSKLVHTHLSLPLSELVTYCNHWSINTYADAFLKRVCLEAKGTAMPETCLRCADSIVTSKGLDTGSLLLRDASGLSSGDYISPVLMGQLLRYYSTQDYGAAFMSTLPKVGKEGTMARLFRDLEGHQRFRLKSGFIRGAQGYAGYLEGREGGQYAVVVMINLANRAYLHLPNDLGPAFAYLAALP